MGSFLGDTFDTIYDIIEPLEPLVDLLNQEIDLGISKIKFIDLAYLALPASTVNTAKKVIEVLDTTLDFLETARNLSDAGTISFGNFYLTGDFVGDSSATATAQDVAGAAADNTKLNAPGLLAGPDQKGLSPSGGSGSSGPRFRIPVLQDPSTILNFLTGKGEVDLFWYDLPDLDLQFVYQKTYPVFPGLNVGFQGTIGATTNFDFGFDTRGLREWWQEHDFALAQSWRIFNGFYVDDHGRENSDEDLPEATLTASVAAVASLGISGLVEAGVAGGVEAVIGFDLHDKLSYDEDTGNLLGDGKLYGGELLERIKHGPQCLFNVSGQLSVFLEAFLWVGLDVGVGKITLYENSQRFVDKVIASFDWKCVHEAPGDIARLNTSTNTLELRYFDNVDQSDAQNYTVDVVPVDSTLDTPGKRMAGMIDKGYLDPSAYEGDAAAWDAVRSQLDAAYNAASAAGGSGHIIVVSTGLQAEFFAADDVDTLIINGTSNNDRYTLNNLIGHVGTITINAGVGADAITFGGEPGAAAATSLTINGGAGSDTITLSPVTSGSDGLASLVINGGDGDDYITVDTSLLGSKPADTYRLLGQAGKDRINLTGTNAAYSGIRLDGGPGDDVIFGGPGPDVVYGGTGFDVIATYGGNDTIYGGNEQPAFYTDADGNRRVSPIYQLDGTPFAYYDKYGWPIEAAPETDGLGTPITLTLENHQVRYFHGDVIDGGEGDNVIRGGDGNDELTAGPGSNTIYGDADDDVIYATGSSGNIYGGAGNDRIIWNSGAGGAPTFWGGGGVDTIEVTLDELDNTVTLAKAASGNAAILTVDENPLTLNDIERVVLDTGAGADNVTVGDLLGTSIQSIDLQLGSDNKTWQADRDDRGNYQVYPAEYPFAADISWRPIQSFYRDDRSGNVQYVFNSDGSSQLQPVVIPAVTDASAPDNSIQRVWLADGLNEVDLFYGYDASAHDCGRTSANTATIQAGWSPGQVEAAIESLGAVTDVSVTGAGTQSNPWVVTLSQATTDDNGDFLVLAQHYEVQAYTGTPGSDSYFSLYQTVETLVSTVWGQVTPDVGSAYQTWVDNPTWTNDHAVDTVTIQGSAQRDYFLIGHGLKSDSGQGLLNSSTADQLLDRQTVQVTHRRLDAAGQPGTASVRVTLRGIDLTDAPNSIAPDRLIVDALGGNDRLIAGMLPNSTAIEEFQVLTARAVDNLTLRGGAGDDWIVGSLFADTIDSGSDNDTVTGNEGQDTFLDAGGTDTLIEVRNKDFTLSANTLNILSEGVRNSSEGVENIAVFERIELTGGSDVNRFRVTNGGPAAEIHLAGGDASDLFFVDLNGLAGQVYLAGDGSDQDTVNVTNSSSADGVVTTLADGVLTSTATRAGARIHFYDQATSTVTLENVNVTLGSGADQVTVADTVEWISEDSYGNRLPVTVTIDTAGGADSVFITGTRTDLVTVRGGPGNDTLNVGKALDNSIVGLAGMYGIIAFVGDADDDTLNVYGDSPATDPGQLSAISVTGMGLATNHLLAVHKSFGAPYSYNNEAGYPGAVYFATRTVLDGVETVSSTVEHVHVRLGAGNDTFRVDSTYGYGASYVHGGGGNDTITVSSTARGLYPDSLGRVDFVAGPLFLYGDAGQDTLIVDDSGDAESNVGVYQGATVSGLGMDADGSVTFGDAEVIEIRLGAQADTFYVPSTSAGIAVTLLTGGGYDSQNDRYDTVYVGTVPGHEHTGSLDAIQGSLTIDGARLGTVFFQDQANTADQTYVVSNAVTETRNVTLGDTPVAWPVDTTTVERTGMAAVSYRQMQTAVINAGQGSDTVNLYGTHREQDVLGGHRATFTVNGGLGSDTVNVGAPQGSGFTLDGFAIDLVAPTPDNFQDLVKGIPVMINGQGGNDVIHFLDSAATANTNLAFVKKTFAELFPANPPTDPPTPSQSWLDLFQEIFGENPQSTPYTTVAMSVSVQGEDDPVQKAININSRGTEHVKVSLGSGHDVVQMTNTGESVYDFDITVYAGDGNDTFNIEDEVSVSSGNVVTFNGEDGDDLVFAWCPEGADQAGTAPPVKVPDGAVRLVFNGGPHDRGGDMLRIAGDGVAAGTYTPSATVANAGRVVVQGNVFDFTGVEPLVVHGLSDFQMVTPDQAAALTIDSVAVADMNLESLVLHVLTVDGQITWSQQTKVDILDIPAGLRAKETEQMGRAVAMSGDTLVVGAARQELTVGAVYVYTWSGGAWVEQAKLYPSDRGSAGQGFGKSVAIDGNRLIVGAPQDNTVGNNSGAAYVFARGTDGIWRQEAKLRASDGSAEKTFGQSVAISGSTVFVGAAGGPSTTMAPDAAYVFTRSVTTWSEQPKLTDGGGDFGAAVAVVGTTAVIGAPNGSDSGIASGRARVYTRSGNTWTAVATLLLPSEAQAGEEFGAAIAMLGDRIVVGAPQWDAKPLNTSENQHGRAFVFEGSGATWTRVARLTQDGGLPEKDAAEAQSGTRFGAAVALSGNYVVIGGPDYNARNSLGSQFDDSGAAWVFYQLPTQGDSGLGASWTRSSGASGAGRLQAANPAGLDNFGAAVAIANNRIVVGLPGFDEKDDNNTDIRGDVGAVQTFTINGTLPLASNDNMRAETLRDPTDSAAPEGPKAASRFGSVTHYDPATKTLFVGDPGQGKVYTYINEGLYWRPVKEIQQEESVFIIADGLTARYYQPPDSWTAGDFPVFANLTPQVTQTEWSINKAWGEGSYASGMRTDRFAAQWTGQIMVAGESNQSVTFYLTSDDGSRLYIGSTRVVDNGGPHGYQTRSGSITLAPGLHDLKVEYFEATGDAGIRLEYEVGDTRRLLTAPDPVFIAAGGLTASYYEPAGWTANNPPSDFPVFENLTPLVTQTEWWIDKVPGDGSFAGGIRSDYFAAQWTGQIMVAGESNQSVTFYLSSDDGSRLYIGSTRVVDNGGPHGYQTRSGAITLAPGLHNLKVEYFESTQGAGIKLEYEVGGTRRLLTGSGFGTDIAVAGNRLVIGAPGAAKAFVYTRSGENWTLSQTLSGAVGSGFGMSVGITGNKVVVGIPSANLSYYSSGGSEYPLNLGPSGAAAVYDLTSRARRHRRQPEPRSGPGRVPFRKRKV